MVRAKFRVTRIERSMGVHGVMGPEGKQEWVPREIWTVRLAPVSGKADPAHENTKFWEASPSGEIRLDTVNAQAVAEFDLDREFYVDFTRAPA